MGGRNGGERATWAACPGARLRFDRSLPGFCVFEPVDAEQGRAQPPAGAGRTTEQVGVGAPLWIAPACGAPGAWGEVLKVGTSLDRGGLNHGAAIFEYIEVLYNRQRIHGSLRYLSPEQFEAGRN